MDTSSPNQSQPTTPASSTAWVAYLFGWITGLIMYFTAKDKFTKFHGAQSILLGIALTIVYAVLGTVLWRLSLVWTLLQLAVFALWILLMVRAYQGKSWKLPVIGDIAETWANKP